jgi:hypothetical protein
MHKLVTFFKSIFSNKCTIKANDLLPVTISHCLMTVELDKRKYRNCNESIQRLIERASYRHTIKVNGYNV